MFRPPSNPVVMDKGRTDMDGLQFECSIHVTTTFIVKVVAALGGIGGVYLLFGL